QFVSAPQCVTEGTDEPMATADRESQQVFDSIEHIGHFKGGGGMSGVAGCTRWFVLPEDFDVLQHYRAALPAAGKWSRMTGATCGHSLMAGPSM
ncbi:hypothetical protein, partial [Arthrobacter sp.]|uniref:hypothetical protein n=1 Tax=Arthrobacter sp. TaxID=1667 RepID=UPI003390FB0C